MSASRRCRSYLVMRSKVWLPGKAFPSGSDSPVAKYRATSRSITNWPSPLESNSVQVINGVSSQMLEEFRCQLIQLSGRGDGNPILNAAAKAIPLRPKDALGLVLQHEPHDRHIMSVAHRISLKPVRRKPHVD